MRILSPDSFAISEGFLETYDFDPNHKGFCRCALCLLLYIDEKSGEEEEKIEACKLEARETHPFVTEIPLAGGVKKKKKIPAKMRVREQKGFERGMDRQVIKRIDGPAPATEEIDFTIVENINVGALAAGAAGVYTFNANSARKPDTATAVVPYAWADYAGVLYAKYRVISFVAYIECASVTQPYRVVGVAYPATVAAVTTAATDGVIAMPHCKYKTIGSGGPTETFTIKAPIEKVLGATYPEAEGDDNFAALVAADPARLAVLNIVINNIGTAAFTFNITVTLKMRVLMFQPIERNPLFMKTAMQVVDAMVDPVFAQQVTKILKEEMDKKLCIEQDAEKELLMRLLSKYKNDI